MTGDSYVSPVITTNKRIVDTTERPNSANRRGNPEKRDGGQHVRRRIDGGQQDSIRFGMPRSVNVNVDDHTLASAVSNLTIQPSAGVTAAASSNAEDAYEELFEGIENTTTAKRTKPRSWRDFNR